MHRKWHIFLAAILWGSASTGQQPWSERMAATAMTLWKDSFALNGKPAKWTYDEGVVLKGIESCWLNTGNGDYYRFIKKSMDFFVNGNGQIRTYRQEDFNIDNINNGRMLLMLYKTTGDERYWKAATLLREQLRRQPRTRSGGFWHKKIYPYQMWLDGLYMAEPFYAEYAVLAHEDTAFNDIARQFREMELHARDAATGLLYHGWDELRQQRWANPATGCSSQFWARAMGWFGMALVDVLEHFPAGHPKRKDLAAILSRYAEAVVRVQDKTTGCWWDVQDAPARQGNYMEASASCMFVYALAKGVRLGILPAPYLAAAKKGYEGIIKQFVATDTGGQAHLKGTVSVSGLGGDPYRDGSYAYYISEKVVTDDPKGMGAFIQASCEMEMLPTLSQGHGGTVPADNIVLPATPSAQRRLTVSQQGRADFRSIQHAINSLPDSSPATTVIYIRNGIYREKLFITKHNIILEGEDMSKTVITGATARDEWRCTHPDDWGTATLNINGRDITLINLTVINSYGFDNLHDRVIACPLDSLAHSKTVARNSHQMALRTITATRLKAVHCRFAAYGGDTVSPWNVEDGLFYFRDCIMEGGVDLYCPRGWAFAEHCSFIAHTGTASIWHDGSFNEDEKTVLKDCHFSGFAGFKLGRYHRDAQFYLINCSFDSSMADTAIYRVPTTNTIRWGHRVYFSNCHRAGGDYPWFGDNLDKAPGHPSAGSIDAHWVFGERWHPEAATE